METYFGTIFEEHHKLMQMDADAVVDILEITTEELIEAFPDKVDAYVEARTNE
jgi:hypothetical protein